MAPIDWIRFSLWATVLTLLTPLVHAESRSALHSMVSAKVQITVRVPLRIKWQWNAQQRRYLFTTNIGKNTTQAINHHSPTVITLTML